MAIIKTPFVDFVEDLDTKTNLDGTEKIYLNDDEESKNTTVQDITNFGQLKRLVVKIETGDVNALKQTFLNTLGIEPEITRPLAGQVRFTLTGITIANCSFFATILTEESFIKFQTGSNYIDVFTLDTAVNLAGRSAIITIELHG